LALLPFGRLSFVSLHLEPAPGHLSALNGRLTLGKQFRAVIPRDDRLWPLNISLFGLALFRV
jgi:hypothetical protein